MSDAVELMSVSPSDAGSLDTKVGSLLSLPPSHTGERGVGGESGTALIENRVGSPARADWMGSNTNLKPRFDTSAATSAGITTPKPE